MRFDELLGTPNQPSRRGARQRRNRPVAKRGAKELEHDLVGRRFVAIGAVHPTQQLRALPLQTRISAAASSLEERVAFQIGPGCDLCENLRIRREDQAPYRPVLARSVDTSLRL